MTLTPNERDCLRTFREAERQVREASVVDRGLRVTLNRRLEPPSEDSAELLDPEAIRSLAITVRRAILQEDNSANLRRVHNILARAGDEHVRQGAAAVLARFRDSMESESTVLHALVFGEEVPLSLRQTLATWLCTGVVHHDPSYDAQGGLLKSQGVRFDYAVQVAILFLAGLMLDIDDVVAEFLGETPLPRIPATSGPESAPA